MMAPVFHARRAFTLIELMVVIGIMALAMTMGVPLVWKVTHKEGLRKAVADVVEVCSQARARAILRGVPTWVVINPRERTLSIAGGGAAPPPQSEAAAPLSAETGLPAHAPSSGLSAQIPERVSIEMIDINFREYKDADQAIVCFYPNGTADEMTMILRDGTEFRKIAIELTTGLADVDSNPRNWNQ